MSYIVYAVAYGNDYPPDAYKLYATRELAEKDIAESDDNTLRIVELSVPEEDD